MSGLFGVYSFDRERRFDARSLFRAARSVPHRDQYTHEEAGLSWAVQSRLRPASLAEDAEHRVRAAVVGHFDDPEAIAAELQRSGYLVPPSAADLAVAAYRAWGSDFVGRIDGAFVLGVYDSHDQVLVLARSGLGHLPLYYRVGSRDLAFSTRLRTLLDAKLTPRVLDPEGAASYFRLGFIPSPRTAVQQVRALPAGTALIARGPEWGVRRHRGYDFEVQDEATSLEAQLDRLANRLAPPSVDESPELWLRPDLPSVVLAATRARATGRPVATAAPPDERTERLAQLLGGPHRTVDVQPVVDDAVRLVGLLDQPFADPEWIVRDAVGRSERQAVCSVGAGPVFSANPAYPEALTADAVHRALPPWADAWVSRRRRGLEAVVRCVDLGPPGRGLNPDFARVVEGLGGPELSPARDPLADLQASDLRYRVADGELVALHGWSSWSGVPVATPYLDAQLVDGAARLPARGRMEGREEGAGLWRLARRLLPGRLRRSDFGIARPAAGAWMQGGLREAAEMAFFSRSGGLSGLLDSAVVRRRWYTHQLGARDHGEWLYALMIFELWAQTALADRSA